jgi:hypothetical protein
VLVGMRQRAGVLRSLSVPATNRMTKREVDIHMYVGQGMFSGTVCTPHRVQERNRMESIGNTVWHTAT